MLTKRQVLMKYGFNAKTFDLLVGDGILHPCFVKKGQRSTIYFSEQDVENLQAGEHYVICAECGAWQNQITTKHLKACCGGSLADYQTKHPDALTCSGFSVKHRAKTDVQKRHQSITLKERFKTVAGEATRKQIQEASKALMQTPYKQKATEHLRKIHCTPGYRERQRKQTQDRWASDALRESVIAWHREHPEESKLGALNARRHLKGTKTKPHMKLKKALLKAGLRGFQTEYEVGFYHLDEAHPDLKIGVEVQGCYWHSCPVCGLHGPKENTRRDKAKKTYLENQGWSIVYVWEHEIRSDVKACVNKVQNTVRAISGVNHVTA